MLFATVVLSLVSFQEPSLADASASPRDLALPNGVRVRVESLPGVRQRALWAVLPFGSHHDALDRPGVSRILTEVLRASFAEANGPSPHEVVRCADATWIGRVVEEPEFDSALEQIASWLRGDLLVDDAALERARDRAVLAADDDTVVLPGPVLRGRALRSLCESGLADALPPEAVGGMRDWSATELRAAFAARSATVGVVLTVLGGGDAALDRERIARIVGGLARRSSGVSAQRAGAREEAAETGHDRVEAPFVIAAIRAPSFEDPDYWPFVFATEALRARAATRLGKMRGNEGRAGFPPLVFDPFRDPLVFLERRGRDGDPVAAPRREIAALLDGFRRQGPTASELAAVEASLRARWSVPPLDERTLALVKANRAVLLTRGKLLAADGLSGFATSFAHGVESLDATRLADVIASWFADDAVGWFALRREG